MTFEEFVEHAEKFLKSKGVSIYGYPLAPVGYFDFIGVVENSAGESCATEGSIDLSEYPEKKRLSYSSSVIIRGKEYNDNGYVNLSGEVEDLEDALMYVVAPVYSGELK